MLHRETVEPHTLELLEELMKIDYFMPMRLVGGTSLSLQIGHRKSIVLVLFGKIDLNENDINFSLSKIVDFKLLYRTPSIFVYNIGGIKVDFVNYPYPWIEDLIEIDGLRLANKKEIGAMKLSAITGRGTKKDFIDLYFLLKEFSLKELMGFYKQKITDGNEYLVLRSLTYFEDADRGMVDMVNPISWEKVKTEIIDKYLQYMDSL